MGATAVLAVVAGAGLVHSVESSNQTRRLAGQAKNRAEQDFQVNEKRRVEAQELEENRSFSKIARQRQRAIAANQSAPGGQSVLTGGGAALGGSPAPAGGGGKQVLGA